VELEPDSPINLHMRGSAYMRCGKWEEARQDYEEYVRRVRDVGHLTHLYLSMIHLNLHDRKRALEHYARAAELMSKKHPSAHSLFDRRIQAEAAELLGTQEQPKSAGSPPMPKQ